MSCKLRSTDSGRSDLRTLHEFPYTLSDAVNASFLSETVERGLDYFAEEVHCSVD